MNATFDGWVMGIFHEYGNFNSSTTPSRITPGELVDLIMWLKSQTNVSVVTVSSNINATLQPIFSSYASSPNTKRSLYSKHRERAQSQNQKKTSPSTTVATSTTTTQGTPYIAFTFDYGTSDHYNVSLILQKYNMTGSFYVSSSTVGTSGYLSVPNLVSMQSSGHEIGSRTQFGLNQLTQTTDRQTAQICNECLLRNTSWSLCHSSSEHS